jgi:hypothetical protein
MCLRLLLVVLSLCLGVAAHAETVLGDKVRCRAAARTSSPALGTLTRGARVPVLSRNGGWSYVDPAALPACWVRSDLLGSDVASYAMSSPRESASHARDRKASYARRSFRHSALRLSVPRGRHKATRRSFGSSYSGGSCPCGGGNICIGPRGGRYCITSGGNKRYGL